MVSPEAMAAKRRELIEMYCQLPDSADVMDWQRSLASEIITAEESLSSADRELAEELRAHSHLLRVIGDSLAWALLPRHTLRALGNHPGKPARIAGQGESFEFVLSVADSMRSQGFVPIVADLTNLIRIGDVVGWGPDGLIALECKNRSVPRRISTNNRAARQRERGERFEQYLRESRVEVPGEDTRIALAGFELPEPDWLAIEDLLRSCQSEGAECAGMQLGHRDTLVAFRSNLSSPSVLEGIAPDGSEYRLPSLRFYSELIWEPSFLARAPANYPIAGDLRSALLEGDLSLMRLVDVGELGGQARLGDTEIELIPHQTQDGFEVKIGNAEDALGFTHFLIDYCLWMPVPMSVMRNSLLSYVPTVFQMQSNHNAGDEIDLAAGDNVMYGTAYRAEPASISNPDTEPSTAAGGGMSAAE